MRLKLLDWLLKDYNINKKYKLTVTDKSEDQHSLVSLCSSLTKEVIKLEKRITILEEKYKNSLKDIVRLEEENVETTNCLYENSNCIESVDRRIDNLAQHFKVDKTLF